MGETEENEITPTDHSKESPKHTEEPKETDKMLNNGNTDTKKINDAPILKTDETQAPTVDASKVLINGEEIAKISANETTNDVITEGVVTAANKEGREVKPKKIPIGGIKMPGFFMRGKNGKVEGDGAEGELLENIDNEKKPAIIAEDKAQNEENSRRSGEGFLASLRNRFNFIRRDVSNDEESKVLKSPEGEKLNSPENETIQAPQQPAAQKKGLLNAIRLPLANMIPKRLKSTRAANDVELGNGPHNRAGLASMETLDDSLKDKDEKDTTDHVPIINDDGLETVKLETNDNKDKKEEKAEETEAKKQTFIERIRNYHCSLDDLAIIGGILLFLLLVGIIIAFTVTGNSDVKSAPVRDGGFVDAVTSCGPVEGILKDSSFAFRGIPYAVPPIKENRFRPAKLIEKIDDCWNGTFKAHNSTQVCWQIYANGSMDGSENCLTLDVITPHIRYDNPLPVVVLIGADSLSGDSPGKMRPSSRYARARDVIFVRPNFRVGVFGFLALDTLSKSVHPPTSGNYALSDIIAALEWIKLNIAHFGGDKDSITLFGHRAGGTLVSALVTSPKAKDLFARAWISSSSSIFPGLPLSESATLNLDYLNRIKCTDAECLGKAEDEELLDAIPDTWRYLPTDLPTPDEGKSHEWLVLDGVYMQKHPADVWSKEAGPPKIVYGTTAHESHSDYLLQRHKDWTPELVRQHIEASIVGKLGLVEESLKLYNLTYQGLVAMISDIRTICPLLTIARQQPSAPFYVVTQRGGDLNIADVDADVSAILGRYEPKTPEQRRYVSAMQQLFYHFVSHGEMKQHEGRRRVIDIDQDALPTDNYPNCDFWIKNDVVPRYARVD